MGISARIPKVIVTNRKTYILFKVILLSGNELVNKINKSGRKAGPTNDSLVHNNKSIPLFTQDKFAIKFAKTQAIADIIKKPNTLLEIFCFPFLKITKVNTIIKIMHIIKIKLAGDESDSNPLTPLSLIIYGL